MLLDCSGDNYLRESVYNFRNYIQYHKFDQSEIPKYAKFINVFS